MPRNKKNKVRKDVPAAGNADAVDGEGQTAQASGTQEKESGVGLSIELQMEDLLKLEKSFPPAPALWDRIRNELKLNEQEFSTSRVATLVWARERGNTKTGRAVLVSFYNEELDECTGQLSLKALLKSGEQSATSVLITHWPDSNSNLRPQFKYFSDACRENGFQPDRYVAKELIGKFVGAFIMEQSDLENGQLNEESLRDRFVGSFDPPLIANSDEDRDKPAEIYLEHVIETDGKLTNVHMFTYKSKLDALKGDDPIRNFVGSVSMIMHWGVIFKFEKERGDVYWTMDGGRKTDKFLTGEYIVRAYRGLPDDIDTKEVEHGDKKEKKPRIKYHGFVRSSRRDVIRIAKQLQSDSFRCRYRWLTKNCQEWASDLLVLITSTYDRFWFGPKTIHSRYYDESGKKKDISTNKRKKKAGEERVPSDRSCEIKLQIRGRHDNMPLTAGSEETYEKLLIDIRNYFDVTEENFNERRLALLMNKLDGEIEVRFAKLQDQTVEESYSIQSKKDGLTITRSSNGTGLVPLDKDSDVKTGLSVRAMFEWCVRMHRWLVVSDEKKGREYSSERFADKFIKSLGPKAMSKTAYDTFTGRPARGKDVRVEPSVI